jgi:hypothetical protein
MGELRDAYYRRQPDSGDPVPFSATTIARMTSGSPWGRRRR